MWAILGDMLGGGRTIGREPRTAVRLGAVAVGVALMVSGCSADSSSVRSSGAEHATTRSAVSPVIPAPSVSTSQGDVEPPPSTSAASLPIPRGWVTTESPPVPTAPVTALLDRLPVATPDPARPDYRRDEFGDGWSYDRDSGCNVREYVLITESRTEAQVDDRCKPLAGDWVSVYDGVTTTDPTDLEIDHVVALSEAWRSGAWRWSRARREAFANDLVDPGSLVAVTTRSNRSKGDSPPDQWLPDAFDARCTYVEAWIRIKTRWALTISPPEKATLVQVLSGC